MFQYKILKMNKKWLDGVHTRVSLYSISFLMPEIQKE